jgi:hypothetical protein
MGANKRRLGGRAGRRSRNTSDFDIQQQRQQVRANYLTNLHPQMSVGISHHEMRTQLNNSKLGHARPDTHMTYDPSALKSTGVGRSMGVNHEAIGKAPLGMKRQRFGI